jgi:hypothetical protein
VPISTLPVPGATGGRSVSRPRASRATTLGRSRGGFTSKLHLSCEQGQKVLVLVVTAGQRGDSPQLPAVLDRIRVPRRGPGRPRTRPVLAPADKTSSRSNRKLLALRGI